jgi:glycine cleavage system transcriptional repressor
MNHWYMLTLVGKDRPGIVAKVTAALFDGGCNLGEASMMRLGGNFAIMLMVDFERSSKALTDLISPVAESLDLHLHLDRIEGRLHQHVEPDVRVTVYGADRAGIVARVTGSLAEAGLNITDLESMVGGSEDKPIYVLQIEGTAAEGIESLQAAVDVIRKDGVEAHLEPIETMIG